MARYEINAVQRDGELVYELRDATAQAEACVVPAIGNNAFRYAVEGIEWLLEPPGLQELRDYSSRYGYPILCPPNRIKNSRLEFDGQVYELPADPGKHYSHGELKHKPWRVVGSGADDSAGAWLTSEFKFEEHTDLFRYMPFALTFRMTWRLQNGALALEGEISNEGTESAPLLLGFHPYFKMEPDAVTVMPVRWEWPVESFFISGYREETPLCAKLPGGVPVSELTDEGYHMLELERREENVVELIRPKLGRKLLLQLDAGFPFVVAFKPSWASAVSFEPYSCLTDAYGLPWDKQVTGAGRLEPQETFRYTQKLSSILLGSEVQ